MSPTPYKIFTYDNKNRVAVIPQKVVAIQEFSRKQYEQGTNKETGEKTYCTLFVEGEYGGEGGSGLTVDGTLEEVIAHLKGSES